MKLRSRNGRNLEGMIQLTIIRISLTYLRDFHQVRVFGSLPRLQICQETYSDSVAYSAMPIISEKLRPFVGMLQTGYCET